MNWFKRIFGLDFIDFAIQFAVTALAMGFVDSLVHGPAEDRLMFVTAGASVVLYAYRRQRALKAQAADLGLTTGQMAAARLEELEQRVNQLEASELRVAELEERLDFAERMLAQSTGEKSLPTGGERR